MAITSKEGYAFNLKLAKKCIKPIFASRRKKLGLNVPQFLPNLCRGVTQQVVINTYPINDMKYRRVENNYLSGFIFMTII